MSTKSKYLFGINPIDLLVIVFIICLLPIWFFAYKITTKPKAVTLITHWAFKSNCPNCGTSRKKRIPLGELKPLEWKERCERCGNEVWFIKPKPKPKLKSEIKPDEMNYEYFYKQIKFKQLLKEKGWLE